ncbi:MAG TPA: recombinase family protein [Pseudomonadota bacterium]|nr:recombinase family protein [Pseudomonadota bacterium]
MKIGYARVSRPDQNLDSQVDALKAAGCERIYTDKLTGGNTARPGLQEALAFCRAGDALVVWRLDRLARSLQDLLCTIDDLRKREVAFISLSEGMDASGAAGRLIFQVFGAVAEFERALIRERTAAGLAAARARGRKGGRPRKLDEDQLALLQTLAQDPKQPRSPILRLLGISKSTLHRHLSAAPARP